MMEKIKNWLQDRFSARESLPPRDLRKSGYHQRPGHQPGQRPSRALPKKEVRQPDPDLVKVDPSLEGKIESLGPGKNVLIRNRLVREEAGTHETLKIVDDSIVDSGEQTGIDPYNTGGFDRSKKWDQRFRK